MLLSVIIPTCNRNDLLVKCLDALKLATEAIGDDLEVVVTDDSKTNAAKLAIGYNYAWVRWVDGPQRGPAANRNWGAKQAKGEWLVFLDDDCIPQPQWLATYVKVMETTTDGVLEGSTDADRPQRRFDEESPINLTGNNLWSCNFAVKKSLFDAIGGFDETFPFPAMEDIDFHTRISKLSKVKFIPGAMVIHPWRPIHALKAFKKHFRSQKHFVAKYKLSGTWSYRWSRAKIFIGGIFIDLKTLAGFSMRGGGYYIVKCFLNFCLIFI